VDGWTALRTHPLVLGPGNVPVIVDPEEAAQDPTLATFCALLHGRNRNVEPILEALAGVMDSIDHDTRTYLIELLEVGLGDTPARATWRKLMPTIHFPGQGTLVEEYFLEGKAEGQAKAILRLLERRGVSVPATKRLRITSCTSLETLDRWFDRAITATDADELFAEDEPKPTE
jgi:hypothetical protein